LERSRVRSSLSLSNIFMRSTHIELCTHNTDWENWNLFCLIFRPERGSEGGRAIADARSHIHSEWQDEYELGQKALFLSFLSFFASLSISLSYNFENRRSERRSERKKGERGTLSLTDGFPLPLSTMFFERRVAWSSSE
jgi:hypothetical protein